MPVRSPLPLLTWMALLVLPVVGITQPGSGKASGSIVSGQLQATPVPPMLLPAPRVNVPLFSTQIAPRVPPQLSKTTLSTVAPGQLLR